MYFKKIIEKVTVRFLRLNVVLTTKNNTHFHFFGINLKYNIITKKIKFTTSTPIPQSRRLVDLSLMTL